MTKKATPQRPLYDFATTPLPDGLYPALHFALTLPESQDRRDVPELLRHLASTLEALPKGLVVSDIAFHRTDASADEDEDEVPSFTVYFMVDSPASLIEG